MSQAPLDIAMVKRKQIESMLAMLKGNTWPDDIRKLERLWLQPIKERIQELEADGQPASGTRPESILCS